MNNKRISGRTGDAVWLLAVTLGLAVTGLLAQLLDNSLEAYIYTRNIVRYWSWVLLASAGAFWLRKGMAAFRCRNPLAFRTVQTALLLVMLIVNIYVLVEQLCWDFSFRDWKLWESTDYADALLRSRLIGRAENMETILPDLFWRWEMNGIIPALSLGYGLAVVFIHIWLGGMWMINAIGCMRHVRGDTCLSLRSGEEVMLELDIARLVYLTALLALAPKVLGQTVSALLGSSVFYGGTLFCTGSVMHLSLSVTEAGAVQLLIMGYLLYLPGGTEPEEDCPADEEVSPEEPEQTGEPAEAEAEAPEAPGEPPADPLPPRELTAEDFARAEYVYASHEWDDECVLPYFHVPGGWYYMTSGMTRPVRMQTGQSVLVGREDYLRRMDPADPGKGEHLFWV